jgi:hypothetical protein
MRVPKTGSLNGTCSAGNGPRGTGCTACPVISDANIRSAAGDVGVLEGNSTDSCDAPCSGPADEPLPSDRAGRSSLDPALAAEVEVPTPTHARSPRSAAPPLHPPLEPPAAAIARAALTTPGLIAPPHTALTPCPELRAHHARFRGWMARRVNFRLGPRVVKQPRQVQPRPGVTHRTCLRDCDGCRRALSRATGLLA